MNIITRNHERYFYKSLSWGSTVRSVRHRYLYKLGDIQLCVHALRTDKTTEKYSEVRCHVKLPRLGARMLFNINLGTVDYTTHVPPLREEELPDYPPVLGEIPTEHRDQLMEAVLASLDILDKYELPTGHMEMVRRTLDEYHHA